MLYYGVQSSGGEWNINDKLKKLTVSCQSGYWGTGYESREMCMVVITSLAGLCVITERDLRNINAEDLPASVGDWWYHVCHGIKIMCDTSESAEAYFRIHAVATHLCSDRWAPVPCIGAVLQRVFTEKLELSLFMCP